MQIKTLTFILVAVAVCAISAFGQANEVTEKQFSEVEQKGNELLKKSTYRLTRRQEYFESPANPGRTGESYLKEVIQPNKWRTVEEKQYSGKNARVERLWDGNALFERENDGPWTKYSGGGSSDLDIKPGRISARYLFYGRGELDGRPTEIYEVNTIREANKYSATGFVIVRYLRNARYWFAPGGRLLKRIVQNSIDGKDELTRETTWIEYDPNIKIEAPIN